MNFGRELVGSPMKIALVYFSIAVAVFWAAENVARPMITNRLPHSSTFGWPTR